MTRPLADSRETIIFHHPVGPLSTYVECLWYYDAAIPIGPDRVLPHGAFELVIGLSPNSRAEDSASLISGPQSHAIVVDPAANTPLVGAHFRPGGAAAILGYPAHEFRDLDVPLRQVWSFPVSELRAKLVEAASGHDALITLEHALSRRAESAPSNHPAVSLAIADFHDSHPRKKIGELVSESGLSQRRFIQLFNDEIGLTPKLYARVQRFQRALRHVNQMEIVDWADVAFGCGYADQAHFVREFREFSGLRPTEYLPRWTKHPNHVPLEDQGQFSSIP